jgi:hypothetical protein
MSTIDSENNGKSASEKRALVAAVLLAKSTRMRLLSGVIGSDYRLPEPLQQRRAYSTFGNASPLDPVRCGVG